MRLSTAEFSQLSISSILEQQSQLSQTQQQLSSGKRIMEPADDPSGAALALQLQKGIDTAQQYQRNGTQATSRLNLEETTLASATNTLQRVRQLVVEANNDSQSDASRQSIAAELKQRLSDVVSLANTQDANGEYIFAGASSQTQPFTQSGTTVNYAVPTTNNEPRKVQISRDRSVAMGDTGNQVFMNVPAGNGRFSTQAASANTGGGIIDAGSVVDQSTWNAVSSGSTFTLQFTPGGGYQVKDGSGNVVASKSSFTPGDTIQFSGIQVKIDGQPAAGDQFTISKGASQSVFKTISDIANALDTPHDTTASSAKFHSLMNDGLASLDQALGSVENTRGKVGARLDAVDSQSQMHDDVVLQLQKAQSQVQDLDYAKAISLFQRQLTGLQAAQQAYSKVQGLSLFNYIR